MIRLIETAIELCDPEAGQSSRQQLEELVGTHSQHWQLSEVGLSVDAPYLVDEVWAGMNADDITTTNDDYEHVPIPTFLTTASQEHAKFPLRKHGEDWIKVAGDAATCAKHGQPDVHAPIATPNALLAMCDRFGQSDQQQAMMQWSVGIPALREVTGELDKLSVLNSVTVTADANQHVLLTQTSTADARKIAALDSALQDHLSLATPLVVHPCLTQVGFEAVLWSAAPAVRNFCETVARNYSFTRMMQTIATYFTISQFSQPEKHVEIERAHTKRIYDLRQSIWRIENGRCWGIEDISRVPTPLQMQLGALPSIEMLLSARQQVVTLIKDSGSPELWPDIQLDEGDNRACMMAATVCEVQNHISVLLHNTWMSFGAGAGAK